MKQILELKVRQNEDGIFDLAIENGDLCLDDTEQSSLNTSLLTDAHENSFNFTEKSGCFGIDFGNKIWTKLDHTRIGDEEKLNFIRNEVIETLNKNYVETGLISFSKIECEYLFDKIIIIIEGINLTNNKKINYNYQI